MVVAASQRMKLRINPASKGFVWARQGWQVCARQPMGYAGLVGMVIAGALMLAGLPLIGPLLVVGLMPLAWMGFMLATRRVMRQERLTPGVLIEAVRAPGSPRAAFARLGAAYVAGTFVVMLLAQLLGPGAEALAEALEKAQDADEVLADPRVMQDMAWRVGLTWPLSLLFWHTPALTLWGGLPLGKALFFSAVAAWRNLGAFVVFGATWLLTLVGMAVLTRVVQQAIPLPALSNMLTFAGVLWLASCFYASLYFTVVDCFENPQQGAGDQGERPEQPGQSDPVS